MFSPKQPLILLWLDRQRSSTHFLDCDTQCGTLHSRHSTKESSVSTVRLEQASKAHYSALVSLELVHDLLSSVDYQCNDRQNRQWLNVRHWSSNGLPRLLADLGAIAYAFPQSGDVAGAIEEDQELFYTLLPCCCWSAKPLRCQSRIKFVSKNMNRVQDIRFCFVPLNWYNPT